MTALLVLRPEPGNARTVAAARAAGWKAVAAPLFVVRPIAADLSAVLLPDALLFTSANAVRAIVEQRGASGTSEDPGPRRDDGWNTLPVYAVGEATAAAARGADFRHVIVGDADAAAIVARAAGDGVGRLLHLAGREHRAVSHPGVVIERVIVYASEAVECLPVAVVEALRHEVVAMLHSARAAAVFARLLDASNLARPPVALLSAAIAEAAGPGWPAVAVAGSPTDAALLAAAARLCEGEAQTNAPRR